MSNEERLAEGEPGAVRGPGADPAEVTELAPGVSGRWLVRTRHTVHVLDFEAGTYERRPSAASRGFAHDGGPARLTLVERWPSVGGRMLVWFDDPVEPGLEHWRMSSTVRSITRVPVPDPEDAAAPRP